MAPQTPTEASRPPAERDAESRPAGAELALDELFDVLSNERRRWVMRYLLAESGPTTLGTLAEHIASIENDKPEPELSSTERKRVYICLYQSHLPKLDEADVVDFDRDRKTVTMGRNFGQIAEYLPGESTVTPARGRGAEAVAGFARACVSRLRNALRD